MDHYELLPQHLKDIAVDVTRKKQTVHCQIKCLCGCETFSVYKSVHEETPFEAYEKTLKLPIISIDGRKDKNGRSYMIWRTFFGIPIGKRYDDELLLPNGTICHSDVIKIRCVECGHEYIIFDGDKHGYDALTTVIKKLTHVIDDQDNGADQKYKTLRKCCGVEVAIQNDVTYEEVEEIFKFHDLPLTHEQYLNAFSWFTVCAVVDGKARVIFDMETS